MNWWPRENVLPKSSVRGATSTADGALQVLPESADVATTICASWLPAERWDQATCTRATPPESTDTATAGRALVRKRVPEVGWSNGAMVATWKVFLEGKVLPKSSERAIR